MLAGWIHYTGEENFHLAIYAWNPLVVVEFAASGHNDALALAFVVGALLIIRRYRMVSTLLLTAAVLVKAFTAMLVPLWVRKTGWSNISWALARAAACASATRAPWPQ